MRVVLDTNVLIRASPKASGPAREVLLSIASGDHVLIMSGILLQEVERVLSYPRVQKLWKMTHKEIAAYLQLLSSLSEMVQLPAGKRIVPSDPDDDAVINTAVAGQAQILCTLDTHFFDPTVLTYCTQHGIRILTDIQLLRLIRSRQT